MATYYWVGGAGTWSTSSTANWSTTSGGSPGAGPPTSADDVVFDANSDTGTNFSVTINTGTPGAVCNDLTFTAPDVVITITGTARILNIYGDITLAAPNSVAWGAVYIQMISGGTQNVTFNGESIDALRFDIVSGTTVVLQDTGAFNSNIRVIEGTFDTNNNNLTMSGSSASLISTGILTRSIILGSSTVTYNRLLGTVVDFSGSNLTFNAGTSTIDIINTGITLIGNGVTFYNVNFASVSSPSNNVILGQNTFNNLDVAGPSTNNRITTIEFQDNQTINGTFSFSSTTLIRRVRCIGGDGTLQPGPQRTLTCNAVSGFSDADFRDIVIAGSAAPASGTRLGDAGNNSGITFDAPKTVYWNLGGTTENWLTDDGWATTSGGSPSSANTPLAQDTCIIDDNSTMPTTAFQFGSENDGYLFYLPAFDCSARTTACTIDFRYGSRFTGNVTLSGDPDVTYTQPTTTNLWVFELATGRNSTLTTNGVLLRISLISVRASATSTLTLGGDIEFLNYSSTSYARFALDGGNVDLNEYKFNIHSMTSNSNAGSSYSIDFGTAGEIICKSADTTTNSCFEVRDPNNFTCSGSRIVRYQGTKTSGTITVTTGNLASYTATNAVDFFIETGSGFVIGSSRGVRNWSSQGYTGTSNFNGYVVYGSFTIGSGHTPANTTGTLNYLPYDYGSGAQTLTTNGRILNCNLDVIPQGATSGLTLNGNLTLGNTSTSGELLLGGTGTFDLNDYDVTCWFFDGDGATAAVLNMGSGTFELTGTGTIWDTNPSTGITINAETSTILSSNTTNTSRVLAFGTSTTIHNLTIGGGSSTAVVDLLYTTDLTLTGTFLSTRSGAAYEIEFQSGATLKCADFVVSGSAGNLVLLSRTVTSPATWSIEKTGGGIIDQVDYCNIEFSNASPGSTWYAGANSVDGGSNTGWIFTAPPPPPAVTATGNFFQLFFP